MAERFLADLHIHSCLSPCSDLDMTPANVVKRAEELGLNMIAISDHNSAENVEVSMKIAGDRGISVIPAMEITSAEEVHVLALFGDIGSALSAQTNVFDSIEKIASYRHDETSQPVVNENNEILSFNPLPLINATSLTLSEAVDMIHRHNGIAIACHIDREAFGIISQLGFIPDGLDLDALEVSFRTVSARDAVRLQGNKRFPVLSFSDAHRISDIGRRVTEFEIDTPTIADLKKCLQRTGSGSFRVIF